MYTGTTVLGEFSELQYSLSPTSCRAASCLYTNLAQLSLFSYNVENHIVNRSTHKITRDFVAIRIIERLHKRIELRSVARY